jgi:putative restriction endonuclease
MNFWWVNQNQTYTNEIRGGFLWSPKVKSNGGRNQFYDYMSEVKPGDIIFSFCDTRIKAVGIASAIAETAAKPNFGKTGANWSREGWLVPVEFSELAHQIRPKDHIDLLRAHLPQKYSPLQQTGNGLQSVYLAKVPADLAAVLTQLIGDEFARTVGLLQGIADDIEVIGDRLEQAIKGRTDIGATTKEQLIRSRRGQGIFKANVRLNEQGCRVTGVTDPKNLRASHIKPWKDCSDEEKLDGCNGFLLAPHVDHLFDRGMISFDDNGDLIISPRLDQSILARWGIPVVLNVGSLNKEQTKFLAYHRSTVLKR